SKSKYTSKIRLSIRKKRKISDKNIEKVIIKKIKQNNREYTPEFVSMAMNLSTFSHTSISLMIQYTKEIITFLTEVAEISIQDNIPQFLNRFSSYEILADKSTRGEKNIFLVCIFYWNENKQDPMLTILNMKDLDYCLASTVSLSVGEAISKNLLNSAQCQYWLTDNIAYMSESTTGAIVKFNQQYSAKATQIPCGLHVLHIASVHFNDTTFGKTKSLSGICLEPHPFNILNLAYYFHCRYNESDKDNLLNMKAEKISELYKA
ncbi:4903_t:CDS:2, partial [Racocetra persica]